MSIDERNFRSTYYEKVGFRSVEEKRSVEILLKEKHLDRGKLRQFCLRFSLPPVHRKQIWKLLLGAQCSNSETHKFVADQRRQEFEDLVRALQVMRVIDCNTPKPQQFFAMWLLRCGKMHMQTNLKGNSNFIAITQIFISMFETDMDAYWMSKFFFDVIIKFENEIPKLVDISWGLLEREDIALYTKLFKLNIVNEFPVERWFNCCFAGILHKSALVRIWDKLCGGSYKILVYVFVVMLIHHKLKLSNITSCEEAIACLSNMTEETADNIVKESIKMWEHHGSPCTIYDKPKPA